MEKLEVNVDELKEICRCNAEYFEGDETENGQRLRLAFLGIVDHVNAILPAVDSVTKVMSDFDFDENTPGNGYRSFVVIVNASFKHALNLCNYIALNKGSVMFKKGMYMKEMEAICHMIASLVSCFHNLNTILEMTQPGELFAFADNDAHILGKSDTINQYAFYGRCLGIQFCTSVQPLLKFISVFMASFSEMYYTIGTLSAKAQSLFTGGKFILDPELRARRIVNISLYASIDFCKTFWFLAESEMMKKIPDFVCDAIAINAEIKIPPEPLQTATVSGEVPVDIPIPSSHVQVSPIQVRLLSSSRREGMISVSSESSKKSVVMPPSEGLILHCHGGGFVAQSSKSHEVYLRDWASNLNVPIVSVDYSLAPEAPFPRALEEVFYVYCWVLKNCHILGSTGEKIIFAGDSAGANLLLGTVLKCIEYNIRRPDGLFLAYVPVIVSSTPSPSRLLSLMDPLLPMGFMLRCLKAYACPTSSSEEPKKTVNEENTEVCSENAESEENPNGDFELVSLDEAIAEEANAATSSDFPGKDMGNGFGVEGHSTDSEKGPNAAEKHLRSAFTSMRSKMSGLFSRTFRGTAKKEACKGLGVSDLDQGNIMNPFEEFKFSVPRNPFLSPYWASDDVLRQLPKTKICSVEFDPCLDDCVMFAKKLKNLGINVRLDILEGLPHGFLNFSKVNKNAAEGSRMCMKRIRELLTGEEAPLGNEENLETEVGVEL